MFKRPARHSSVTQVFVQSTIEIFPEPIFGTVEQAIAPHRPGRVQCLGTSWPARFHAKSYSIILYPEMLVTIVGIQGITLLVLPSDGIE